MHSDSIEGIYDTLKQCALISKSAGGIGLNVHKIRATGSYIAGVSAGSVTRAATSPGCVRVTGMLCHRSVTSPELVC